MDSRHIGTRSETRSGTVGTERRDVVPTFGTGVGPPSLLVSPPSEGAFMKQESLTALGPPAPEVEPASEERTGQAFGYDVRGSR